jgi:hypothetical protein
MKELAIYDVLLTDGQFLLAKDGEKWGIIDYANEGVTGFNYEYLDYFK